MPLPWQPAPLPPNEELETRPVLKKLTAAYRALAELKGILGTIPDAEILLNILPLQEAKDSSAVENIITTHDELFRAAVQPDTAVTQAAKEVQNYAAALQPSRKRIIPGRPLLKKLLPALLPLAPKRSSPTA